MYARKTANKFVQLNQDISFPNYSSLSTGALDLIISEQLKPKKKNLENILIKRTTFTD
jgi:hypothetical protein